METAPVLRPRRASQLELTGYAVLEVLLFPFVVASFVLLLVSGVLVIAWVGVMLLLLVIPASRALTHLHRWMAGRALGHEMPSPYLPLPAPTHPGALLARLRIYARDPMTYRELLWHLWAKTAGFAIAVIVIVLFAGVVTLPLWWFLVGPLMRGRYVIDRAILSPGRVEVLEERVQILAASRAGVVDDSAAELRRIERDLHDGPQARLAALSLSLGMADDLIESDPVAARQLISDARTSSTAALGEIRDVVRGIHPPVLADRGLVGAVEALALAMAIPVELHLELPGRAAEPLESAVYFAVAECLANLGKHSGADQAWITIVHDGRVLHVLVGDDGRGGADLRPGGGLAGIRKRLAAFDGTLAVSSPVGGPTTVRVEVPCALSSPKTMLSSGPG